MQIVEWAKWAAAIGGGIAAINQWIVKPMKKLWDKQTEKQMEQLASMRKSQEKAEKELRDEIDRVNSKIDILTKGLAGSQDDIADLLGERLYEMHCRFSERGWCSAADKHRYVEMHQRYSARGHNHLTEKYEEDLLNLPDHPQK